MHDYLKVKSASLAAEAKIIRKLERKRLRSAEVARAKGKTESVEYHNKIYTGLHQHRINDVRKEARWTNISYGFLRGHEYNEIERLSYTPPDWDRVEKLVYRYYEPNPKFNQSIVERFTEWKKRAIVNSAAEVIPPFISTGNYQPRSLKGQGFLMNWWLRSFQVDGGAYRIADWRKWVRSVFPLKEKKIYIEE